VAKAAKAYLEQRREEVRRGIVESMKLLDGALTSTVAMTVRLRLVLVRPSAEICVRAVWYLQTTARTHTPCPVRSAHGHPADRGHLPGPQ
jgi:hypothetical protein